MGNACEFTTSAFLKCIKMECVLSQQSPDIMLEQSVRPGHPILIPLSTTGRSQLQSDPGSLPPPRGHLMLPGAWHNRNFDGGRNPQSDTPQRPNEVDNVDTWFQVHANSTVNVRSEHMSRVVHTGVFQLRARITVAGLSAQNSLQSGCQATATTQHLTEHWNVANVLLANHFCANDTDPQRGVNTDCRRCGARVTPH